MWQLAQFVVIGVVAGVLSGFFGIGGGLVVVPLLIWLAKMPTRTAMGTSLGALTLPVVGVGAYSYWRAGDIDLKASLLIAGGIACGAFVGSRLSQLVDAVWLQRAFALLLVVVAVRMWMTAGTPRNTNAAPGQAASADIAR